MTELKSVRNRVPDGQVILGQGGPEPETYVTRHRIEHPRQRSSLCRETLHGDCIPCCSPKHSAPWRTALVAAIRSEILLFSLHMFTIVIGVLKGQVTSVHESEVLHLVHSCLETAVTIFLIAVRLSSAWSEYRELKEEICENISHSESRHIEGHSIRNWLIAYTVFCVLLIVLCAGALLAFHFTDNLGWTVLVNQFCLIVILSTSGLFMARIELARVRHREDEYKTVIHEGALILGDILLATTAHDLNEATTAGSKFARALERSPHLQLPAYVYLLEDAERGKSNVMNDSQNTGNDSMSSSASFNGMKATSL